MKLAKLDQEVCVYELTCMYLYDFVPFNTGKVFKQAEGLHV